MPEPPPDRIDQRGAATFDPPSVRSVVEVPPEDPDLPEITPWDRGPLMVVLAICAALVLLGVVSGVAASFAFRPEGGPAWRDADAAGPSSSVPVAPPGTEDTVTLAGVGDVIMGTQPDDLPPRGGKGFFDDVADALKADVVMGNLETPLTRDTGRVKCRLETPTAEPGEPTPDPTPVKGCHQFYLPPSYAGHLRDAGFHVLNLANNHTNDMGPAGLTNTRKALTGAGLKHTGGANQITYVDVRDVRVAVLGFATYAWGQNLNNIPAAKELVRKADKQADIVVVQMQGGAEGSDRTHVRPGRERFLGEDRGDLIAFSHAVVDAGADAVFGHGPHVMRGMQFYKGRLIAFSLGNFCGYGVLNSNGVLGVGGVLKVTLRGDGSWAGGELVPTRMVKGGRPAPDPERRALALVNRLSREDFDASAARIATDTGKITPAEDT
jgi:hypothetical protein